MSSYYQSFNYMGLNSLKDKHLIVVHFDPDQGETDTFLGMEPIYTESAYGTRRLDYGAKYNSVAVIKITVMKASGHDFTVTEVRDFLKWTTGSRVNSYLDLLVGDDIKFSFLGRVTSAYQQKLDARTTGLSIEFTSVSPWAYSPEKYKSCYFDQKLYIDKDGVVYKEDAASLSIDQNGVLCRNDGVLFAVDSDGAVSSSDSIALGCDVDGIVHDGQTILLSTDENGVVYNNTIGENDTFDVTSTGIAYFDNSVSLTIDNRSDDLYTYVNLNTKFINNNSDYLSIKNVTTGEETIITDMSLNEIITLSDSQFILSDKQNKIFGNSFNFVWPRLVPGVNEFIIGGSGSGIVEFTYRYPIKIGDCAIDIDVVNGDIDCGGCADYSNIVSWDDIVDTPSTIKEYGITDAYTMIEIDNKFKNTSATVDEEELNNMLDDVFGE